MPPFERKYAKLGKAPPHATSFHSFLLFSLSLSVSHHHHQLLHQTHLSSSLSDTGEDGWHLQISGQQRGTRAICCWLRTSPKQRGDESRGLSSYPPQGSLALINHPKQPSKLQAVPACFTILSLPSIVYQRASSFPKILQVRKVHLSLPSSLALKMMGVFQTKVP